MTIDMITRDRYLQKKYGVTLAWYIETLEKQGWGCAICGSKPITRSLPVDHDHKRAALKPNVYKVSTWWNAQFSIGNVSYLSTNFKSKKEARDHAKTVIKSKATRGIICFNCNAGLRRFRDNPDYLASAASYLRKDHERFILK